MDLFLGRHKVNKLVLQSRARGLKVTCKRLNQNNTRIQQTLRDICRYVYMLSHVLHLSSQSYQINKLTLRRTFLQSVFVWCLVQWAGVTADAEILAAKQMKIKEFDWLSGNFSVYVTNTEWMQRCASTIIKIKKFQG